MSAKPQINWLRQPKRESDNVLLEKAITLFGQDRLPEAIAPLERYLGLHPNHYEAVHLRAEIALKQDDLDGAIKGFTKAISLQPLKGQTYYNLGIALQQRGNFNEALRLYDMALDLKHSPNKVLNNRGYILRKTKRYDEALATFNALLEQDPQFLQAYINRSGTFLRLHRLQEALADCDTALSIDKNYVDAWFNRGFISSEALDYRSAMQSYEEVLKRNPSHWKAKFALSLRSLALADFSNGWQQYEVRFLETSLGIKKLNMPIPEWDGTASIEGKRVLVYFEQGLGDTLQFCRFVPRLADLGAEVWLMVQPALHTLIESLDPRLNVVSGGQLPVIDFILPLMSLPRVLQINDEQEFGTDCYLSAPAYVVSEWQAALGEKRTPRIGLTWSGNAKHQNDHERSLSLTTLLPHLPTGLEYVVVQKDLRDEDAALLASQTTHTIRQLPKEDFADTAALCQNLDLVISVDTSVAHLAGAVGCPLWVLLPFNPDWRWQLERCDSPWYGESRLWRQPNYGDWNGILTELGQQLQRQFLGGENLAPV